MEGTLLVEATEASLAANGSLLTFPSALVEECGRVNTGAIFTKFQKIFGGRKEKKEKTKKNDDNPIIWKPSLSFCSSRGQDLSPPHGLLGEREGGMVKEGDVDVTRACKIRINASAEEVEGIWFVNHELRRVWDDRTCLDCRKISHDDSSSSSSSSPSPSPSPSPSSSPSLYWFLAKPKPFIALREFVYAYRCVSRKKKKNGSISESLYAGGSVNLANFPPSSSLVQNLRSSYLLGHLQQQPDQQRQPPQQSQQQQHKNQYKQHEVVGGYLQGVMKIKSITKQACEVTYLLRILPSGSIPKRLVQVVANELMFTLMDLKKRAEGGISKSEVAERKKIAARL